MWANLIQRINKLASPPPFARVYKADIMMPVSASSSTAFLLYTIVLRYFIKAKKLFSKKADTFD